MLSYNPYPGSNQNGRDVKLITENKLTHRLDGEKGEIMIEKVVLTSAGFIVVYASGRTRIYSCPYKKLPLRVQQFIDNREKYAESYGDVINAIVWR